MTEPVDPFGAPKPAGKYPGIAGLDGRLLLVTPKSVERVPGYDPSKMVDRLTADVVVLTGDRMCRWDKVTNNGRTVAPQEFDLGDGEPYPAPTKADPNATNLGFELTNMWISNGPLVRACEDAMNPRKSETMVLGTIASVETKYDNDAWILRVATEEEKVLARNWLSSKTVSPFG